VANTLDKTLPVSANNPCPFLRSLVAAGELADRREPLDKVADVIVATAARGEGHPVLPRQAIRAIGLIANGLGPAALLATARDGLKLNALRGGPLDKKGVGSGLLDAHGDVDATEVARLKTFAKPMTGADGVTEPGLGLTELRAYMDANFERAGARRRRIDRALMVGEWPVLLKVMGKEGASGRYLSLREVVDLFKQRRLPQRMQASAAAK
jgi:hypothetical protein